MSRLDRGRKVAAALSLVGFHGLLLLIIFDAEDRFQLAAFLFFGMWGVWATTGTKS